MMSTLLPSAVKTARRSTRSRLRPKRTLPSQWLPCGCGCGRIALVPPDLILLRRGRSR